MKSLLKGMNSAVLCGNSRSQDQQMHVIPEYVQVMNVTDSMGRRRTMLFPKALNLNQPKRCRTTFSRYQLDSLEAAFERCRYLVGQERRKLADLLQLSETQVKVWYQNRRTKSKKSASDDSVEGAWCPLLKSSMFLPQRSTPASASHCHNSRRSSGGGPRHHGQAVVNTSRDVGRVQLWRPHLSEQRDDMTTASELSSCNVMQSPTAVNGRPLSNASSSTRNNTQTFSMTNTN